MNLISDILNGKYEYYEEILKKIAEKEKVDISFLVEGIKKGEIIIPANIKRKKLLSVAIGKGLFTKINANVGTSKDKVDVEFEVEKAKISYKYGADAIMDLSTWGDLSSIRKRMMDEVPLPLGTVPVYELAYKKSVEGKKVEEAHPEEFLEVVKKQAEEGVDFMTIHAGVCREVMDVYYKYPRKMGIVSRGGAMSAKWMEKNKRENPYYEFYDELLEIMSEYDVAISLGDGMRPGCLADATDRPQLKELEILGMLAERAFEKGVQVMIEGPGHIPLNQIEMNMKLQQVLCNNRPFYVLGPVVTDIAPGYDHITSAIGGAIAASSGADFLCYVTPAEHLRLPDIEDVREGVIASKIAAHAADIVKRGEAALERDYKISVYRRNRNWEKQFEYALDPEKAKKMHYEGISIDEDVCSMCSEFCPMKIMDKK